MKVRRPILRFLYFLYWLETGIFLLLAPWSALWIRNSLAHSAPLGDFLMNGHVRGAVSGLGLLMIVVGMVDFAGFCRAVREP